MMTLMRRTVLGAVAAVGLAALPVAGQHGDHGDHQHGSSHKEPAPTALPKCPVMGEPANFAVSVSSDEGPIFFCCKDCISLYQANPAKYAAKVAEQRKVLAERPRIQVTCPVTGEPVNPDVYAESDGKKVYFCCKGCVKKYQREPAKYAAALANSYTYQTKCPVMGEEIAPKVFLSASDGSKIYFCCKGCDKKFSKDPQKYAANLSAQGVKVSVKELTGGKDAHEGHDH